MCEDEAMLQMTTMKAARWLTSLSVCLTVGVQAWLARKKNNNLATKTPKTQST